MRHDRYYAIFNLLVQQMKCSVLHSVCTMEISWTKYIQDFFCCLSFLLIVTMGINYCLWWNEEYMADILQLGWMKGSFLLWMNSFYFLFVLFIGIFFTQQIINYSDLHKKNLTTGYVGITYKMGIEFFKSAQDSNKREDMKSMTL